MAAGSGRIPDFYVVGHPKSGTTALSAMLSQHPQIRPPDEAFMADLRQRLKPEVVALSEYLDRDLVSPWGYGELG